MAQADLMGLSDAGMPVGKKVAIGIGIAVAIAGIGGAIYYWRKRGGALGVALPSQDDAVAHRDQVQAGGMTLKHYRGRMPIQRRLKILQDLTWNSVRDPRNRQLALAMTRNCPARDGECEARAIYEAVRKRVRYTGDVGPVKMPDGAVEGVDLFQSAYRTWQFGGGDCLPLSTLVLRNDYQLVPLAALNPGDQIMADGQWTTVQERWLTGEKELLAFDLSNGCVLRCTPEHRVFRHVDGRVEEVRASEIKIGDDLITPEQLPTASSVVTWPSVADALSVEDRAWLLGVFVADGWADGKVTATGWHPYRVGISGRDGKPKEAQKRRVEQLMAAIGVHTRWHERYIAINNADLARMFAAAGSGAANKHLPQLAFRDRSEIEALLTGLAADADRRNGVFGTISPLLALQLRVLYRMLGQSVHIRRVDNHGGFGENPIYRVTPRSIDNTRGDVRFARVRAIRDGGVEMCADLTTDRHKFWLPESDTIVHNCDDHSVLAATMLALNGLTPKFRVTAPRANAEFSHIYPLVGLPKGKPTKWVALDTTLPGSRFGYEVPYGRHQDFPA